jgi:hypothetical protein
VVIRHAKIANTLDTWMQELETGHLHNFYGHGLHKETHDAHLQSHLGPTTNDSTNDLTKDVHVDGRNCGSNTTDVHDVLDGNDGQYGNSKDGYEGDGKRETNATGTNDGKAHIVVPTTVPATLPIELLEDGEIEADCALPPPDNTGHAARGDDFESNSVVLLPYVLPEVQPEVQQQGQQKGREGRAVRTGRKGRSAKSLSKKTMRVKSGAKKTVRPRPPGPAVGNMEALAGNAALGGLSACPPFFTESKRSNKRSAVLERIRERMVRHRERQSVHHNQRHDASTVAVKYHNPFHLPDTTITATYMPSLDDEWREQELLRRDHILWILYKQQRRARGRLRGRMRERFRQRFRENRSSAQPQPPPRIKWQAPNPYVSRPNIHVPTPKICSSRRSHEIARWHDIARRLAVQRERVRERVLRKVGSGSGNVAMSVDDEGTANELEDAASLSQHHAKRDPTMKDLFQLVGGENGNDGARTATPPAARRDNAAFGEFGATIDDGDILAEIFHLAPHFGQSKHAVTGAAEETSGGTSASLAEGAAAMTEEELAWAALEREAEQYTRISEQIDLDEGRSSPKVGDHHHQMDAILMGLLQDLPQGLDTADESGNATIHIAAQHGNLELVNYLLREGANANLINTTGATPLAVSCYLDFFSVPIAHALIGKGARVALPVDMSGGGAFEESSGEAAMPMSALHHAVNSYREGVEGGVEMLRLLVGTSPHEHLAVLRTMFAESQGDECVVCLCEGGQQHADLETCLRITA